MNQGQLYATQQNQSPHPCNLLNRVFTITLVDIYERWVNHERREAIVGGDHEKPIEKESVIKIEDKEPYKCNVSKYYQNIYLYLYKISQ